MASGECHACGEEYARLRQHWSMSDCPPDPEQSSKVTLECDECGEPFDRWRYRVDDGPHYCSHDCKDAATREGEYRECATCGDEVYVPPSRLESMGEYSIDRHFCDKECESEWKGNNWVGEDHPVWDGGNVTVECAVCDSEFGVKPSKAESQDEICCSRECLAERQSVDTETRSCDWCGADIERKPYQYKVDSAYCSNECRFEALSRQRMGQENPAWKGGRALVDAVRASLGPRSWPRTSDEIRAKAGWTCEACGESVDEQRLHAHHIVPVASGGTNEEWNLMALCINCHGRAEDSISQYVEPHLFPE